MGHVSSSVFIMRSLGLVVVLLLGVVVHAEGSEVKKQCMEGVRPRTAEELAEYKEDCKKEVEGQGLSGWKKRLAMNKCIVHRYGYYDPGLERFDVASFKWNVNEYMSRSQLTDKQKNAVTESMESCISAEFQAKYQLMRMVKCMVKACVAAAV